MIKRLHFSNQYIFAIILMMSSSYAAASQSVLVVHSYHAELPWTSMVKRGIDNTLGDLNDVFVHHEYMDTKRHPSFFYRTAFLSYLNSKYSNTVFDVIVAVDDASLTFIRQKESTLFTDKPVVFLGINKVDNGLINHPDFTGVFENRDIASAVLDIKALTKTDELIVITDNTKIGQDNLAKLKKMKKGVIPNNNLHVFVNLKHNEISDKLSHYSPKIPILKIGQLIDPLTNNALLSWGDSSLALTSNVVNPVFTLFTISIQNGAVGSSELNAKKHGEQGAIYVKRILAGEKVSDLPPTIEAKSVWTFNWQQMKHNGFDIELIPTDSKLINKDVSFYEKYKLLVFAVITLFIVALLVIGLLVELIRRGHQTRAILSENESRYKQLAEVGANIFWEINTEYKITYLSGNTSELLGKSVEELMGQYCDKAITKESMKVFSLAKAKHLLHQHLPLKGFIFKRKIASDNVKVFLVNGRPIFDKNNDFIGYRGICNDVTAEHKLSEALTYQAEYDPLTRLINRERFLKHLTEYQNKSSINPSFICVLDLDRFKLVNDIAGHLVGNVMLTKIAEQITCCIEDEDILGRFGGDEFGLLLINKPQKDALAICEKIVRKVNQFNFSWNDKTLSVGVSIGILALDNDLSEAELISKADISCYKAKDLGRSRVYFADQNNTELATETLQMGYIANISQAIKKNQFYLVKQLIEAAKSNESHVHYEILLRFKDDDGNNISPVSFIPAAEKYGVITLIDYWVVSQVFDNYSAYFLPNTLVSINLSGLSLSNNGFIQKLTTLVVNSSVDCRNICFEITETAAISNLSGALVFIAQMKELGIKFALDDFGSGASSFGYLKQLPVDYLKIDGSLIKNMLSEPIDRAIIQSIHEVAGMMNMETIAEFVENDELRSALEEIGINFVQGYGIGKPIPCIFVID